jgi:hypothetical protein
MRHLHSASELTLLLVCIQAPAERQALAQSAGGVHNLLSGEDITSVPAVGRGLGRRGGGFGAASRCWNRVGRESGDKIEGQSPDAIPTNATVASLRVNTHEFPTRTAMEPPYICGDSNAIPDCVPCSWVLSAKGALA